MPHDGRYTLVDCETASELDSFSDLAYLVNSELVQSEPAKTPTTEHTRLSEHVLPRNSVAESAIIPRESIYDIPPPVPPKDTPPKSRIYALCAASLEALRQIEREQGSGHERGIQSASQSTHSSILQRQSSSTSGEIPIHLPASILEAHETAAKRSIPTYVLHPLMMSPVRAHQKARTYKRSARPPPLRLPSLLARDKNGKKRAAVVLPPRGKEKARSCQTQPHTGYMTVDRTKYGRGKYATTVLLPQPSDDPRDPLNWPTWKKELHLYALLVSVAVCNATKTALVSVNSIVAERLGVSYVAVSALTGVPLMVSALTGLASGTASKVWGRRPVYLVSLLLVFIGIVWNSQVSTSYAQFMVARVFQGSGWGAFDTIVLASIMDTYFEHERSTKVAIYRIVSVATTWGPPLLGGLLSQSAHGPSLQFELLAVLLVVSVPMIVLGAPESRYHAASPLEKPDSGWTPGAGGTTLGPKNSSRLLQRLPAWARGRGNSVDKAIRYIQDVAPLKSYGGPAGGVVDLALVLQTPCALVAPTTGLLVLASLVPHSLFWGFSSSLSGLFSPEPFGLFPATVGAMLATPLVLATAVVALFALWPAWSKIPTKAMATHLPVLAGGAALSFVGTLAFGLYGSRQALHREEGDAGLRFAALLSFVLGLLAAGAYVLDALRTPRIWRAAQATAAAPSSPAVDRRADEADLDAGVAAWRALSAGVFVMATPAAVVTSAVGLRNVGIGTAVVQVVVAGAVGAVWYVSDRKLEGEAGGDQS